MVGVAGDVEGFVVTIQDIEVPDFRRRDYEISVLLAVIRQNVIACAALAVVHARR